MDPSATASDQTYSLRLERTFDAPRKRVFDAWTRAEEMKRWMAPAPGDVAHAQSDLRVGGTYACHMHFPDGKTFHMHGHYVVVEPPSRVVLTWQWEHEPNEESRVTVEFHERENGKRTTMILVHERFSTAASRDGHEIGWNACLQRLADALASREIT